MAIMQECGRGVIVTGSAKTITLDKSYSSDLYAIEFRLIAGTPAAGTTAVTAIPKDGTSETVKDSTGAAINIDPTALEGFYIAGRPLESITLTPSSWTAGVQIGVVVRARA